MEKILNKNQRSYIEYTNSVDLGAQAVKASGILYNISYTISRDDAGFAFSCIVQYGQESLSS
jgi:hypothetical protein